MDARMLQNLQQAIHFGIEEGMKAGAAHIAEALASPKLGDAAFQPFHNGVTLAEMDRACRVLIDVYLDNDGRKRFHARPSRSEPEAWKTLRRALNLPV